MKETRTWTSPVRELDYLIGIRELFEEVEADSVHANAGKHTTCLFNKTIERTLKAFGGCKFIEDEGVVLPLPEAFWGLKRDVTLNLDRKEEEGWLAQSHDWQYSVFI